MITGIHAMFYSSDPDATRTFLRDVLGLPANDAGGGWLIFTLKQAEVGVHPTEDTDRPAGTHEFSLYSDDVYATVKTLEARGAKFSGPIEDTDWGLVTRLQIPGGCSAILYQRKY